MVATTKSISSKGTILATQTLLSRRATSASPPPGRRQPGGVRVRRASHGPRRRTAVDREGRRHQDRRTAHVPGDAALFYPTRQGQMAGGADLDRHPAGLQAPRVPRHGPAPGRRGLCGAGAQPLLPRRADARRRHRAQTNSISASRRTAPKLMPDGRQHHRARTRSRATPPPSWPSSTYPSRRPIRRRSCPAPRGYCMGGPLVYRAPRAVLPKRPDRGARSPATAAAWSPRRRPARTSLSPQDEGRGLFRRRRQRRPALRPPTRTC